MVGAVLGLESSCDESAAALLDGDGRVLAQRVWSQSEHARFGGVVPELAARAHLQTLPGLVRDILDEAGVAPAALAAVAATVGPGLVGGLLVGSALGKGLAMAARCRFVPVDHLAAHALTARLPGVAPAPLAFPYLLLLVSGGHCQCVAVRGVDDHEVLGATVDDAAGEAFDKVAKMLGLPFPGGPALERLAAAGDAEAVALPRPMLGRPGCDFSFSGLKTAVRTALAPFGDGAIPRDRASDVAASFQRSVALVLADRAAHALLLLPEATALVAAGGVAANGVVRAALTAAAAGNGVPFVAPPLALCTDNATMVAWAAIERLRAGLPDAGLAAPVYPRRPAP